EMAGSMRSISTVGDLKRGFADLDLRIHGYRKRTVLLRFCFSDLCPSRLEKNIRTTSLLARAIEKFQDSKSARVRAKRGLKQRPCLKGGSRHGRKLRRLETRLLSKTGQNFS